MSLISSIGLSHLLKFRQTPHKNLTQKLKNVAKMSPVGLHRHLLAMSSPKPRHYIAEIWQKHRQNVTDTAPKNRQIVAKISLKLCHSHQNLVKTSPKACQNLAKVAKIQPKYSQDLTRISSKSRKKSPLAKISPNYFLALT